MRQLRLDLESRLRKVSVGRQSFRYAASLHDDKRNAIGEGIAFVLVSGEVLPSGSE